MERFTGQQRAFCVKQFYKNSDSYIVVRRLFRAEYGLHNIKQCPSVNVIRSWIKKFEATGSTLNQKPPGRPRSTRTEQVINEVRNSVKSNPGLSDRKRSAQLAISRTSLRRIFEKDLAKVRSRRSVSSTSATRS